jgi:hypothetical protein
MFTFCPTAVKAGDALRHKGLATMTGRKGEQASCASLHCALSPHAAVITRAAEPHVSPAVGSLPFIADPRRGERANRAPNSRFVVSSPSRWPATLRKA